MLNSLLFECDMQILIFNFVPKLNTLNDKIVTVNNLTLEVFVNGAMSIVLQSIMELCP